MANQPRGRGERQVSKPQQHHPSPPKAQAGDRQTNNKHTTPSLRNNHRTPPTENDGEPPSKRRKLSIRSKQTTLDGWTLAQSEQVKPPTKITVQQPRGQLVETVNGVRNTLDAAEDEVCQPTPRSNTPRSTSRSSRVPQPDLHLSTNVPKQEDKRTLRSQDEGPRLKSELAIYFPNYEDIIFDAPREPEFITVDSTIYITDDSVKQTKPDPTSPKTAKNGKASHARKGSINGVLPSTPHRTQTSQFNGSPSLNLEMISRTIPAHPEDPLTDEHFMKSHRRAERKEKQLRNIEKERAMHEKVQLDRLLEGLKGHDWLKTLGITGITDGEAKKYEPKRDYFIAEVQALVDKFKLWKEQEKRQKLDKEAAAAAREEEQEADDASEESSMGPPSSDLNASAARQLQQETAIALKSSALKLQQMKDAAPPKQKPPVQFVPPPPEIPIASFYDKRHLRDAALGKARHGRKVYAFGQPVPEMEQRDFELPEEYVSEDVLRSNAREKRRRKRASTLDAAGSGAGS